MAKRQNIGTEFSFATSFTRVDRIHCSKTLPCKLSMNTSHMESWDDKSISGTRVEADDTKTAFLIDGNKIRLLERKSPPNGIRIHTCGIVVDTR